MRALDPENVNLSFGEDIMEVHGSPILRDVARLHIRFDGFARMQRDMDTLLRDIHCSLQTQQAEDGTQIYLPGRESVRAGRRRSFAVATPWSTRASAIAMDITSTGAHQESEIHENKSSRQVSFEFAQANLPPPRDSSERSSSNAMSLKTRSVRGNSDTSVERFPTQISQSGSVSAAQVNRIGTGSLFQTTSLPDSGTVVPLGKVVGNVQRDSRPSPQQSASTLSSLYARKRRPSEGFGSKDSNPDSMAPRPSLAADLHYTKSAAQKDDQWAELFGVRIAVPWSKQHKLLKKYGFNNILPANQADSDDGAHGPLVRSVKFLKGTGSLRLLKMLALVSLFIVPLEYALMPTCDNDHGRAVDAVLKTLHFLTSTAYCLIVAGRWHVRGVNFMRDWTNVFADGISFVGIVGEFFHFIGEATGLFAVPDEVFLLHMLKIWRAFVRSEMASWRVVPLTVELVFWFLYMGHLAACMAIKVARWEQSVAQPSWADDLPYGSGFGGCADFYATALYFSSYTMTGVGYGDVVPVNGTERMLCALYMVISQLFAAKIFADVTWITETLRHQKARFYTWLSETEAVMGSMQVPSSLQRRVRAYQDFVEKQRERGAEDCLKTLSRPLQEELKLVVYYDLVSTAPFLMEQPTSVVRAIIMSLKEYFFLPFDVIVRKGDIGTELFFLRKGTSCVFSSSELPKWQDTPVKVLSAGSYFGEVALLTGMRRRGWVVAKTFCACSILTKQFMDQLFLEHPACLPGMVQSFQRTLGLESKLSWREFGERLGHEFESEDALYHFLCNALDADSPSGVVAWKRWEMLAQRMQVSNLDSKLLWIRLSPDKQGHVDFDCFMQVVEMSMQGDASTPLERSKPDAPNVVLISDSGGASSSGTQDVHPDPHAMPSATLPRTTL